MFLVTIHSPDKLFSGQPSLSEESSLQNLKSVRNHFETSIDESIFPDDYPEFLKQVYIISKRTELLKKLSASDREFVLRGQGRELQNFFRGIIKDDDLNVNRLYNFARTQVGQKAFETFLRRFGIDQQNHEDIELEVSAQIKS
jgi:hypothetical protein